MTVTLNQLTQEYGATVYTNLQTQNPSPTGINTKMTQSPKPRVKKIKSRLVGKKVSLKPVQRARELEEAIADIGFTLNLGRGVDLPEVGIDIKTRDVDAVSPHTVASMTADSIVATPYRYSNVFDKIQKQHRNCNNKTCYDCCKTWSFKFRMNRRKLFRQQPISTHT